MLKVIRLHGAKSLLGRLHQCWRYRPANNERLRLEIRRISTTNEGVEFTAAQQGTLRKLYDKKEKLIAKAKRKGIERKRKRQKTAAYLSKLVESGETAPDSLQAQVKDEISQPGHVGNSKKGGQRTAAPEASSSKPFLKTPSPKAPAPKKTLVKGSTKAIIASALDPRNKHRPQKKGGTPRPRNDLSMVVRFVNAKIAEERKARTNADSSNRRVARSQTSAQSYDQSNWPTQKGKLASTDAIYEGLDVETPPIPQLAHGLQRVLFQDPHSRVYNFDPALEVLPPIDMIKLSALNSFTPPSKDDTLRSIALQNKLKYIGSTSSMTGLLKHFHFLLSRYRQLDFSHLSHKAPRRADYTRFTKGPEAVYLRYKDGLYAVDADKTNDAPNVLSLLGHYLEKYLTADKAEFDVYKHSNKNAPPEQKPGAYHYSKLGGFLIRSQLDARDSRLPGTGIFDLKTRAVLPIRMNSEDFEKGMDYELMSLEGEDLSYEREFVDMSRATMIKYMLQARMGRMDGIFVAFHNIGRIFGFQYMPIGELDSVIHHQTDTSLGDQEFGFSLKLLDLLVERAVQRLPNTTLRIHIQCQQKGLHPVLLFFAQAMSDKDVNARQSANSAELERWAAEILDFTKFASEDVARNADAANNVTEEEDLARFRARARKMFDDRARTKVAKSEAGGTQHEEQHGTIGLNAGHVKADNANAKHATVVEVEADHKHTDDVKDKGTNFKNAESEKPSSSTAEPGIDTNDNTPDDYAEPPRDKSEDGVDRLDDLTSNLGPENLVAFELSVFTKLNGKPVDAPYNLSPASKWTLDYTMKELPTKIAIHEYQKSLRDKETLYKGIAQNRMLHAMYTLGKVQRKKNDLGAILDRLTDKSRKWRRRRDSLDKSKEEADKGVFVWDSPHPVERKDYVAAPLESWVLAQQHLLNDQVDQQDTALGEPVNRPDA